MDADNADLAAKLKQAQQSWSAALRPTQTAWRCASHSGSEIHANGNGAEPAFGGRLALYLSEQEQEFLESLKPDVGASAALDRSTRLAIVQSIRPAASAAA